MPPRRKKPTGSVKPRVRIPLPRQTGGVHEDKTRRPFRKAKYRKIENE